MNKHPRIIAIVPAAGIGSRMQSEHPKQYLTLQGKTVLEHSLAKLQQVSQVAEVVVAINPHDPYFPTLNLPDNIRAVTGGKERADSVLAALNACEQNPPDWVLVHDAARPLVDPRDIENLIKQCLSANEGGILAAPMRDTVKQGGQHIEKTIPREALFLALTPQFFRYDLLRAALTKALAQGAAITDEASAIEWVNEPVKLVQGRSDNFKLTTPEDLQLADFLLAKQQVSFT